MTGKRVIKNSEQLATEHWLWVVRWLEMVYKDAFIHGYKHGVSDTENESQEKKEAKQ